MHELYKKVNAIKEKLMNDYNVLREIEFSRDIDMDESDKFYLNSEKGYLEFLMKVNERIRYENLNVLLGESINTEKGIEMLPTPASHVNLSYNRCMLLINRIFDLKRFNCIYMNFDKSIGSKLQIIIGNKNYFNIINEINKYGRNVWEKVNSIDVKATSYHVDDDKFYITKLDRLKKNTVGLTEVPNIREQANLLINSRKYAKLNNVTTIYSLTNNFEDGHYCISLVCDIMEDSKSEGKTYINNLLLGDEEGFIYIKPLSLPTNSAEVFTICSGSPIVQYFSQEQNKWIDIVRSINIKDTRELAMRIKMKTGERIYSILLLKRKQEI